VPLIRHAGCPNRRIPQNAMQQRFQKKSSSPVPPSSICFQQFSTPGAVARYSAAMVQKDLTRCPGASAQVQRQKKACWRMLWQEGMKRLSRGGRRSNGSAMPAQLSFVTREQRQRSFRRCYAGAALADVRHGEGPVAAVNANTATISPARMPGTHDAAFWALPRAVVADRRVGAEERRFSPFAQTSRAPFHRSFGRRPACPSKRQVVSRPRAPQQSLLDARTLRAAADVRQRPAAAALRDAAAPRRRRRNARAFVYVLLVPSAPRLRVRPRFDAAQRASRVAQFDGAQRVAQRRGSRRLIRRLIPA